MTELNVAVFQARRVRDNVGRLKSADAPRTWLRGTQIRTRTRGEGQDTWLRIYLYMHLPHPAILGEELDDNDVRLFTKRRP